MWGYIGIALKDGVSFVNLTQPRSPGLKQKNWGQRDSSEAESTYTQA